MGKKESQPEGRRSWDGVVRRQVDISVRGIDEEKRSVEVVASTDTLDAHGDVVEQKFKLQRYRRNPVVLWMHNMFGFFDGSTGEDFFPVGRAEKVKVEDGQLVATLVFGSADYSERAEKCWLGFKERILRAVSIGFRPGKIFEEEIDGKKRFRLTDNELFEISVVPIPSNPDAVAKSIAFEHEQLHRIAERTGNSKASPGETETSTMDEKELQNQLEQTKADLAVAKAAAKRAEEEREALAKKLEETEATLAETAKSIEGLTKARDEAVQRAEKAEDQNIKHEVKALVGKKITPAEEEEFIELRKSNPTLFRKMVEKRADMPHGKDVTGEDPDTQNKAGTKGGASSRLSDRAKAKATKAA